MFPFKHFHFYIFNENFIYLCAHSCTHEHGGEVEKKLGRKRKIVYYPNVLLSEFPLALIDTDNRESTVLSVRNSRNLRG